MSGVRQGGFCLKAKRHGQQLQRPALEDYEHGVRRIQSDELRMRPGREISLVEHQRCSPAFPIGEKRLSGNHPP